MCSVLLIAFRDRIRDLMRPDLESQINKLEKDAKETLSGVDLKKPSALCDELKLLVAKNLAKEILYAKPSQINRFCSNIPSKVLKTYLRN